MKSKDKKDLFTKSEKELLKILKESKDALLNLNMDHKQNKVKDTRSIFWKRKEIAWIKTALSERKLAKEKAVDQKEDNAKNVWR